MSTTTSQWFLSIEDKVVGPLSWAEVEQRVRGAQAENLACVRADGSEAWRPYKAVTPAPEPTREHTPPPPLFATLDSESVNFCETAVRIGVLTPEVAHQILEQRRVDRAIGYAKSIYTYLEEHHILTVDQIAAVLAAQKTAATPTPPSSTTGPAVPATVITPPKTKPIKFATLFPVHEWIAERPWSNRWVRWFAFFALFPVLVGQLVTVSTTIGDVVWALGIYFGVVSGFVLYLWLQPERVPIGQVLGVAAFTALVGGLFVLGGASLPIIHQLYELQKQPDFFSRAVGSIFGTGLVEETAKAFPIYWLFIVKKKPVQLRTCAFLAAISGLAFGVLEAVNYSYLYAAIHAKTLLVAIQETGGIPQVLYAGYMVSEAARLVSLPLLHALFAALVGTFIAFATVVSDKKISLIATGLGVAAVLHGLYDAALFEANPSPWLALSVALLALLLFTLYSHTAENILAKLQQEQSA